MANVFTNLAVPAADGVGAAVDVRSMSGPKTITVGGSLAGPSLTVEFSLDNANWFAVATFSKPGQREVELAAGWMRTRISGFAAGMTLAANVDVGAKEGVARAVQLPVSAGDGVGAAVDVSLFGSFNTIVCSGTFTGAVHVEISEDNTDWQACGSFANNGSKSKEFSAQYMRVRRGGCDIQQPGTPVVYVAAIDDDDASTAVSGQYETFLDDGSLLEIYVDGVNGDDQNDGLSETTALETIQEVYRKFPTNAYQESRIRVHLAGVGGFGADATAQLQYTLATLIVGGAGSSYGNSFAYVGPEMVPITPATGPATAALDNPPAVAILGGSAKAGGTLSVRFDFTGAAPGWTVDDLQRRYLRITRGGEKVTWEMPISRNTADTITVRINGVAALPDAILATDTAEIVEPAVDIVHPTVGWWGPSIVGEGGWAGGYAADTLGSTFQRIQFTNGATCNAQLATFDRCNIDEEAWGFYIARGAISFFNCVTQSLFFNGGSVGVNSDWPVPTETGPTDPIVANRDFGLDIIFAGDWVYCGAFAAVPSSWGIYYGLAIDATYKEAFWLGTGFTLYTQGTWSFPDTSIQGVCAGTGSPLWVENGARLLLPSNVAVPGSMSVYCTGGGVPLKINDGATLACDYGVGAGEWEEALGYNGVLYIAPAAGVHADPQTVIRTITSWP